MSWYWRLVNAGEMGLLVYPVFEVKRASLAITDECKFSLKARACFEYFSKYRKWIIKAMFTVLNIWLKRSLCFINWSLVFKV